MFNRPRETSECEWSNGACRSRNVDSAVGCKLDLRRQKDGCGWERDGGGGMGMMPLSAAFAISRYFRSRMRRAASKPKRSCHAVMHYTVVMQSCIIPISLAHPTPSLPLSFALSPACKTIFSRIFIVEIEFSAWRAAKTKTETLKGLSCS